VCVAEFLFTPVYCNVGVKIWRTRAMDRRKWACFVGEAKVKLEEL
jgi:hypothetical protein